MTSSTGEAEAGRQSIADIFASFYEDLCRQRHRQYPPANPNNDSATATTDDNTATPNNNTDQIRPFTMDELRSSIKQLRNGKCKDTSGIVAEMIKLGGARPDDHLLQLYNDVILPYATPPTT